MDTVDEELDYGEGELGAGLASGVSLGALHEEDDEDTAQDGEYDDLYDDVNIGYFEDQTDDDGQKSNVKPHTSVESKAMEHESAATSVISASIPAWTLPSRMKIELKGGLQEDKRFPETWSKIEVKEELLEYKRIPGLLSRQDAAAPLHSGHHTELAQASVAAVTGSQSHNILPPNSKEQGDGYNNGVRQGVNSYMLEKTSSPFGMKPAPISGSGDIVQTSQSGGHTGGGFSVGPGRAPYNTLKEKSAMENVPFDKTGGTATSLPRSVRRDVSPIMVHNENMSRPPYSSDGNGMLFVGDLHWWTTDAELEAALLEYGRVKNLKFFEERVSGKSKGCCQVEFYDHASAVACKHGMNGRQFHDRPCVVALGDQKSIQQMGYQQEKKTHPQTQGQQEQMSSRRNYSNNGGGTRGNLSYQERDSGRGDYGRVGSGRLGMNNNRTGQGGSGRGRGSYMNKGMGGGGGYGQGHSGPMGGHQSPMMMHQGMMGQGYDPAYGPMGRGGAAYAGYVMPGPTFPGMVVPFPAMGPGALPGVAPHVNPAFFGRPNGMGLMHGGGMEGPPHQGMWGEGGWSGEDHDRRARDGSYTDDGAGMDYGHNNDLGLEKGRTMGGWEKESGNWSEKHRRDDKDGDWEREAYKEKDRNVYMDRDRSHDKDEEWDRERPARPTRHRGRMVDEDDDPRQRSREEDHGRKRRMMERELP